MKISRTYLRRLINEIIDPVSGKIKVYHMFGKDRHVQKGQRYEMPKELVLDRVKAIMKNGFIPGDTLRYGKGMYGVDANQFRDLSNSNAGDYGNYALEFEIKDFTRYLVFDYEKAKEVKGEKYRLIDQFAALGIGPETFLVETSYTRRPPGGEPIRVTNKKTVREFSEDVDMYNEEDELGNDQLKEDIAGRPWIKNLDIHGCFVRGFFVCWDLKSVVLTGYCDDNSKGEIKPLPRIEMK